MPLYDGEMKASSEDAQPLSEHPEMLIAEYENISKEIVELSAKRLNLGIMIFNNLEGLQARKLSIDTKFNDRMDNSADTNNVVEKSRGGY